jgi:hypothetical protein
VDALHGGLFCDDGQWFSMGNTTMTSNTLRKAVLGDEQCLPMGGFFTMGNTCLGAVCLNFVWLTYMLRIFYGLLVQLAGRSYGLWLWLVDVQGAIVATAACCAC